MTEKSAYFFAPLLVILIGAVTTEAVFEYKKSLQSLEIYLDKRVILQHSYTKPAIAIGKGKTKYENDLGNFHIEDELLKRISLNDFQVSDDPLLKEGQLEIDLGESPFHVRFSNPKYDVAITLQFESTSEGNVIRLKKSNTNTEYNRMWLRLTALPEEHVYGGGEQFSHFNLRGRTFPMWVREQGVGRNKSTMVTYLADIVAGAGGDYHTSYWPQPTFVSDRLYYAHLDFSFYSLLNFSSKHYHEIEMQENFEKAQIYMGTATSWPKLLEKLTSFMGRQPLPPHWLYNGAIIGLQGGTEKVLSRYRSLKEHDVKISAIWIQDWAGKFMTSLGKRVYWNWRWDKKMYPNLEKIMKQFKEKENVRFLSYINPHVIKGSEMFDEADNEGYFIKSARTGKTQLVDFGEMECGSVDLTNPKAYDWYKKVVQDIAKLGFSGWMADFGGEYLPVDDSVYYDGRPALEMHNIYSELWAQLNREAVKEMGIVNDVFVFMRSGFGKSPGYTSIAWGGDQNVDFSYGDGLASTIPAALSLGMSGMGLHHSDVGGYVSLLCMVRTEELVLRWAEMNVFTPVLRTHEGNRPDRNWQIYTNNATTKSFSRMTELYIKLAPYHGHVASENTNHGYPAQRPLFFHYMNDPQSYEEQYEYLYGQDLLVAPVLLEGQNQWSVYLPPDEWVYLWNSTQIIVKADKKGEGKTVQVHAELGNPPVFYRKGTQWEKLFQSFSKYNTDQRAKASEGFSWQLLWENPLIFIYLLLRKLFWYILFND
ncbi:sulfoquinovosidase-like [Clavelina lepadiformis]|uniref:sulfoquinovosidase-like n=1 Tax=Clavelina lepadiformis TaxID=159417 RepID=UPI0040437227